MIESLRKQFCEGAGVKDMKLVTTRASKADAEDRQNIIKISLIKKQFRRTTRGTFINLVCLFFA